MEQFLLLPSVPFLSLLRLSLMQAVVRLSRCSAQSAHNTLPIPAFLQTAPPSLA